MNSMAARAAAWVLIAFAATIAVSAAPQRPYAGRLVSEILQDLQAAGLRILFSSDLVTPAMRVKSEPVARDSRKLAVEILAPHGLTLRDGPRGVLLVVALPRPAPPAERKPQAGPKKAGDEPEPLRIQEFVDVSDRLVPRMTGSTNYAVPPSIVRETAGGFENVFQVFQVLPGAAALDDESGKLAVRGAGPEHNIVVLDGVQIHNPYRFSELTSSFLNPDTAATVALDASGLDARHGGRLSSVTTIETRDGTRDRRLAVSAALGLANGNVLLEGRLPKSDSGSWWLTARGTYYRPVVGLFRTGVLPNFSDVQAKVTTRPTARTILSVFALAGQESMRGSGEFTAAGRELFEGSNRLGVMNLSWTAGSRLVTTTTLSGYAHDANDYNELWTPTAFFERNTAVQDLAARQRAIFAISPRHLLDAGVDVHRIRSSWRMSGLEPPIFWRGLGPSTWGELVEYPPSGTIDSRLARTQVGLWLQDRIPVGRVFSIEPGVRLDWNSYTGESAWQPRLRVAARVGGTAVWAGFAEQTQTPAHESLQGYDYFQLPAAEGHALRNERSRQVVVGFERSLGAGLELRAEAYRRRFDRLLVQRLETDAERDARLAAYALPPDLPADSVILEHRPTVHPESTGRGSAEGVELLVRRNGERINGWVGYTFAKTTREAHGYRYPFDFDRPHTLSAVANLRLLARLRLSATVLTASGFAITPIREEVFFMRAWRPDGTLEPIATPLRGSDGTLRTAPSPSMRRLSLRNSDRLGHYSRADVRLTYATGGRWEFYGEVINLFGSRNYLQRMPVPSLGGTPGDTATANNVYEHFERLPSFGVRVRF